jgi:hypothetical protein
MDKLYSVSYFLFCVSFISLIFLFYTFDISETKPGADSDYFKFTGKVMSVRETNKTVFIEIENYEPIKAFFFVDGKDYSDLKGKTIVAKGKKFEDGYIIDEFSIKKDVNSVNSS